MRECHHILPVPSHITSAIRLYFGFQPFLLSSCPSVFCSRRNVRRNVRFFLSPQHKHENCFQFRRLFHHLGWPFMVSKRGYSRVSRIGVELWIEILLAWFGLIAYGNVIKIGFRSILLLKSLLFFWPFPSCIPFSLSPSFP